MSETTLVGPDGREYTIDSSDTAGLKDVLSKGFRVTTAEAPQTFGEKAKATLHEVGDTLSAGATGALTGLTAGLSNVGLQHIKRDFETPAEEQARRDFIDSQVRNEAAHPIAKGAGEFAGMVLSPVNKIAAPIEGLVGGATVASRIAGKAASQAGVGALFGAGNAVSEAALGNQDLTAESLMAGAGLGAVLGAAGGGLGGAIEEGARVVLPKVGKAIESAQETLAEFADQRWIKASAATKGQITKIPEAEHKAVADVIRAHMPGTGDLDTAVASAGAERDQIADVLMKKIGVGDAGGLKATMPQEEALAALNKGFEENGAKVGGVLRKAEEMGAKPDMAPISSRIDALEQSINPAERRIAAADFKNIRSDLEELAKSKANGFSGLNDLKSTLQKDINYVADSGAKNAIKKQLIGILRDEIDTQIAPQIGADLSKEFLESKQAFGALKEAAKAVKKKSATGADAITALVKNSGVEGAEVARLSALNHADNLLRHGLEQKHLRFLSPSDYATGLATGVMTGNPLGALHGIATAIGHKVLREKGSAIIGTLADKIANSPALATMAESFGKNLQTVAPALGRYAPQLSGALARSPAYALATHMTLAHADPAYAHAAAAAGFSPEPGDAHEASLGKAHAISSMAAVISQHNAKLDAGIEKVLRGKGATKSTAASTQDFGSKRMRKDSEEAHIRRVKEIRQLAADPNELINRTTANVGKIADHAPGVAASIAKTANAAVQYLTSASQEPPKGGPMAKDWAHTDAERKAFADKLEVIQDPMSVLRHASAGTLTNEQMMAFRAVYPTLAQQVATKTMERMAENPKSVPYRARLMLGMLTGTDPDGTIASTASNQAAIHGSPQKPSNEPSGPTSKGAEKLTLANRTATPDQRRELGEDR